MLCFTLYLGAIFQVRAHGAGGLYLEGRFHGGVFALPALGAYIWRGQYMEGLIFRLFTVYKPTYFNSRAQIVINSDEFHEDLQTSKQQILNGMAVWLCEGSGWTIFSLDEHYINTAVIYNPVKGSSYIPLPKKIQNSAKGLIHLKNKDDKCFRWYHIQNLNPQGKNPQRIKKSDKKMVEQLNYEGIKFPVAVKQYNKIEKQNNININVFGYEDNQFYPMYISKEKNQNILNLL